MAKVTIYTTPICPYCQMAKQLLDRKGAAFDEIDVMGNPSLRSEMQAKSGREHRPANLDRRPPRRRLRRPL